METTFKCYYCDSHSVIFGDIINHSVDIHENEILKIRIKSTTETYTRNFTINPKEEHEKGKVIIPNDETRTIKISRLSAIIDQELLQSEQNPGLKTTNQ